MPPHLLSSFRFAPLRCSEARRTLSFLIAALIGVILFVVGEIPATYAQAQESTATQLQTLQKQLDNLQSQMSQIQGEINQLSGSASAAAPNVAVEAAVSNGTISTQAEKQSEAAAELKSSQQDIGKATSTYETTSQDPLAAPRVNNEPLDPRYPGYFRLPGTSTFLRIGGYFKTDFIYDLKPAGDGERFIPASIPIRSPITINNTTVSIRPTRLNLDFLIPTDKFGKVRFFIEGDFFGSSSTTPRLRHAYAQVRNLLIGQTFSNFMDPDAGPDQLDFQGPNAQINIRNPQIRYSVKVRPKTTFSIAVEKPSSDISFEVEDFSAQPNSPSPDGTLQLRREMDRGHVQLAALFRSVSGFLNTGGATSGPTDSVFAWGFNLTGSQRIFGKDTAVFQTEYGNGIERYIQDTSGLGEDAALKSVNDPRLKALPVFASYGAYQHFWTSKVRSSLIYGFAQIQNTEFQGGSVFHQSNYSAGNIIWNAIGSLNIGAEFLYGWRVNKDGTSANAPRIMLSAKYNFVKSPSTK
jgi:DcaP outer membrane protein